MSDRRLAALPEIIRRLGSNRQPEALLTEICRAAQEITDSAGAHVELLASDRGALRATRGAGPASPGDPAAVQQMIEALAVVIHDRKPLRRQNSSGAPDGTGLGPRSGPIFSFLAVPIASAAAVLGWIDVRNKVGGGGFTDADEEALAVLGAHAALVIESARLTDARRVLEAQLAESQRLAAVGLLAGGVAHDFNNLLVAILGYAEFLSVSVISDEQRRDLDEILAAGHRAAALTAQLLAFSRQQSVQPRVLDINPLVLGMCSMLRRVVGEQITLVTRLGDDLPTIRADEGQLQQLIVNFALHARHAMPAGGTLSMVTRTAAGPEPPAAEGRAMCLSISDTGAGLEEDPAAGAAPTAALFATALRLVIENGGRAAVRREPGRGTTIEMEFPAARSAPAALSAPAGTSVGGHETVLVVDDEPAIRNLLRTALTRAGYTVIVAVDPADARQQFAGQPVALLFTDIVMPGGNGLDLFRELSALRPGLRVLYTSGYADSLVDDVRALPGENYVQKPFVAREVVRRIRAVLDR